MYIYCTQLSYMYTLYTDKQYNLYYRILYKRLQ